MPVSGAGSDYDRLLSAAAGATRVLLGESTHGTHEYYRERARITQRLIREHGFNAIAIEGDWSPTYRVNLYVRGLGDDRSATQALGSYKKFPKWMWRNSDFRDFVEQLRAYNMTLPAAQRVGIYGADVYDLFEAADAAVAHLRSVHPAAARQVRAKYNCFRDFRRDVHAYGTAAQTPGVSCAKEASSALALVRRLPAADGVGPAEARFAAIRAAESVAAAEEYFRTVYAQRDGWNLRDQKMAANIEAVAAHAAQITGREGKVVMWSHNSHTGDARGTGASLKGEFNIGQLMKQRHGDRAMLVGFLTHSGTVAAAPAWDQDHREFTLKPAIAESDADLFHRTGLDNFLLVLRQDTKLSAALTTPLLQRAVGVVYVPHAEMQSHYGAASLAQQFDATIYFDRTRAVRAI
ncbi:MAG TPA: erythromycin esterase family protein [Sphingomicrobium sp.]